MSGPNGSHINSIDYLRAIMSVFVVIWHTGGAGRSPVYTPQFANASLTVSDVLNFHFLLLAVPSFIFISIFLYAQGGQTLARLQSRFSRLLLLYLFWPAAFIVIMSGTGTLMKHLGVATDSVLGAFLVFFSAGVNVFYFFASLLAATVIAHVFMRAWNWVLFIGFVLTSLSIGWLPHYAEENKMMFLSSYWSPLNFTPYIFLALLFAKNLEWIRAHRMAVFAASVLACVGAAWYDWNYLASMVMLKAQGYAVPCYMRTSLIFGVSALMTIMLTIQLPMNRVIAFMSKYSLALYCLHAFFISTGKQWAGDWGAVTVLAASGIIIALSYVAALILQRFLSPKLLF